MFAYPCEPIKREGIFKINDNTSGNDRMEVKRLRAARGYSGGCPGRIAGAPNEKTLRFVSVYLRDRPLC